MQIRAGTVADLPDVEEIDSTIESMEYLHVDRGGEGLALTLAVELRPLRQKVITPNGLTDDLRFRFKQTAGGVEEGIFLVAEHDGAAVAAAVAQVRDELRTLHLYDIRVDFDHRREGLATAMLFQFIADARQRELRAVSAETLTANLPANRLLEKLGFEIGGIDLRRHTNHDMIKEAATLLWYAALD